ncbi:peptide ABC transporter substrate-binding protein [Vibrio sp. S17_S38]|uniref:peptide ABC transporter substrate-binding protein n=1 Tax=Vibrio sp. S17_S38 TaxID=2720229 RepID=UPI001680A865|nr:peptide ABC transporter substrate-binding protein [Vibrio sp. S17_S38]MBD1572628.1 peptide ABC transporter substrate-binding protein [Vibrio sp. S17_S38]
MLPLHLLPSLLSSTHPSQQAVKLSLIIGTLLAMPSAFAADIPTGTQLSSQQTLVRGNFDEPPSLDPAFSSTGSSSNVIQDMFEGLVSFDKDGNVVPSLASHWDTSKDGKVYTFHLRPNIQWSDGTPITAQDFEFEYKRLIDPALGAPYAWYYSAAKLLNANDIIHGKKSSDSLGVKALDSQTLQITLEQALPYFTQMLIHESFFPTPEKVVKKYGKNWTSPQNIVTSSAYVLKEHVINERIVLERNTQYWNDNKTAINKVTYLPLQDANSEYNRFRTGEISLTGSVSVDKIAEVKKSAPETLVIAPKIAEYYYGFNTTKAPFDDVRVRKAFSYAIDRNVIANRILNMGYAPAYTFTPPATANYSLPKVEWQSLSQQQRVEQAKSLLTQAGYGPDHPLEVTFDYPTDTKVKRIAVAVASMLKQNLNVTVHLENQDIKTFLQKVGETDFTLSSFQWGGDYNEASTFLDMFETHGYNPGKWSNANYDKLMAQAKTTMNDQKRLEIYHQAEQILAQEMPAMPIYFETKAVLKQTNVGGYSVTNPGHNRLTREMYITK